MTVRSILAMSAKQVSPEPDSKAERSLLASQVKFSQSGEARRVVRCNQPDPKVGKPESRS